MAQHLVDELDSIFGNIDLLNHFSELIRQLCNLLYACSELPEGAMIHLKQA